MECPTQFGCDPNSIYERLGAALDALVPRVVNYPSEWYIDAATQLPGDLGSKEGVHVTEENRYHHKN